MCSGRLLLSLLLVGALGAGLLRGEEQDGALVSVSFPGSAPGVASGLLVELLGQDIALDDQILGTGALWLHLEQASTAGTIQALAHASNGWWWEDHVGQRTVIQSHIGLDHEAELSVRSHPTNLTRRYDLEPVIMGLMEPWLARSGSGIAHVPWTGQWTATLDSGGHAQLSAVLARLERTELHVPSPLPHHDQPPQRVFAQAREEQVLSGDSWPELLMAAAKTYGFSLAVSPAVVTQHRGPAPSLRGHSVGEFAAQLRAMGFHARWLHGVLCVDVAAPQRRAHPAMARRFAVIPVPHLAERYDGRLIATALKRASEGIDWDSAGRTCLFVDDPPRLILALEGSAINSVLDRLDHLERRGSLEIAP